jgi:hypothetical protein
VNVELVPGADPAVVAAARQALARTRLEPDEGSPAYSSAWRVAGLREAAGQTGVGRLATDRGYGRAPAPRSMSGATRA